MQQKQEANNRIQPSSAPPRSARGVNDLSAAAARRCGGGDCGGDKSSGVAGSESSGGDNSSESSVCLNAAPSRLVAAKLEGSHAAKREEKPALASPSTSLSSLPPPSCGRSKAASEEVSELYTRAPVPQERSAVAAKHVRVFDKHAAPLGVWASASSAPTRAVVAALVSAASSSAAGCKLVISAALEPFVTETSWTGPGLRTAAQREIARRTTREVGISGIYRNLLFPLLFIPPPPPTNPNLSTASPPRRAAAPPRAAMENAMEFKPPQPGTVPSKYNNEPGSGRTGYWEIPPNNYDFYSEDEKYKPQVQADGAVFSSAWGRGRVASSPSARLAARTRLVRQSVTPPAPAPPRLGAVLRPDAGTGGGGPQGCVRKGCSPRRVKHFTPSLPPPPHAFPRVQGMSPRATDTRAWRRSSC